MQEVYVSYSQSKGLTYMNMPMSSMANVYPKK